MLNDDDSLSEDSEHAAPEGRTSHPVTAAAGLLPSLQTAASMSGSKRRWANYFELAGALQRSFYTRPFRSEPSYMAIL